MILKPVQIVLDSDGNQIDLNYRPIRSHSNYKHIIQVVAPNLAIEACDVTVSTYGKEIISKTKRLRLAVDSEGTYIKGADVVSSEDAYYAAVSDYNVWEVEVIGTVASILQKINSSKISIVVSFSIPVVDARALVNVGTFGSNGDLPAITTETEGDYRVCNLLNYTSALLSTEFKYNDIAIYDGSSWIKGNVFRVVQTAPMIQLSVDPSLALLYDDVDESLAETLISDVARVDGIVSDVQTKVNAAGEDIIDINQYITNIELNAITTIDGLTDVNLTEIQPNDILIWDGSLWSNQSLPEGTVYTDFIGSTIYANGSSGLVPQPLIADRTKFLKGDGTWSEVVNVESDPVFTSHPSYTITNTNINNWNTSYSWGDHSLAGYTPNTRIIAGNALTSDISASALTSSLEVATTVLKGLMSSTDKSRLDALHALLEEDTSNTVVDSINEVLAAFEAYPEGTDIITSLAGKVDKVNGKTLSTNDLTDTLKTNYDTAYSWGDHSTAGYLTDYTVTELDVTQHEAAITITESQISNLKNYLTSYTETDPVFTSHTTNSITDGTGFLKNNGTGTWTYDNSTYLTSVSAADVSYSNTTSGLTATNTQTAIDEVAGLVDGIETLLAAI